jgi:D-lactate dehydrogenase
MTDRVLPALLAASDGGRLPIVCDAASCTEGLATMQAIAATASAAEPRLRFVDATTFVRERMLGRLVASRAVGSVAVHRTCSTTALGANADLLALAAFAADTVYEPDDWGCCAYAGDRGLLHPELTASATAAEAAEITAREFDDHVSANRTCELGMTTATGRAYRHVLELVEEVTRPTAL